MSKQENNHMKKNGNELESRKQSRQEHANE